MSFNTIPGTSTNLETLLQQIQLQQNENDNFQDEDDDVFENPPGYELLSKMQAIIKRLKSEGYKEQDLKVSVAPLQTKEGEVILDLDVDPENSRKAWYMGHSIVKIRSQKTDKILSKMKHHIYTPHQVDFDSSTDASNKNKARDILVLCCDTHEAAFCKELGIDKTELLQSGMEQGLLRYDKDSFDQYERVLLIREIKETYTITIDDKSEIVEKRPEGKVFLPEKYYRKVVFNGKAVWKHLERTPDGVYHLCVTDRPADQHKPFTVMMKDLKMAQLAALPVEKFVEGFVDAISINNNALALFLKYLSSDNEMRFKRFLDIKSQFRLLDREGEPTKGFHKMLELQKFFKDDVVDLSSIDKDFTIENEINKELYISLKNKKNDLSLKMRYAEERILHLERDKKNIEKNEVIERTKSGKDELNSIQKTGEDNEDPKDDFPKDKGAILIELDTQKNLYQKTRIELLGCTKQLFSLDKMTFDLIRPYLYDLEITSEIEKCLTHRGNILLELSKHFDKSKHDSILRQINQVLTTLMQNLKEIKNYQDKLNRDTSL